MSGQVEQQHYKQQFGQKPQQTKLPTRDQSEEKGIFKQVELWLVLVKQQQHGQKHHPVEQQLDQKSSQKQLAVRNQMNVITFTERAGLWYKNPRSQQQPQQKYVQQYSQEQQQIQLQEQKVQQPLQQEQQPLQQNKQYEHKSLQTPGLTGQSPIQTPGQTRQDPIQTPGQTGQDPIRTPGQTGQGPILANRISLHHDAHGQGRFSAQMSPTKSYSEYHFQQNQQHTGVDDRQPTYSPQSSLVPDTMSLLPSVPHLQKRTWLTKRSSTTDAYNAAKVRVRQEFNDGIHPDQENHEQPQQLKYSRFGQISKKTVEEMKDYLGEKIGEGAFGMVYKANRTIGCEKMIMEIKVTNEVFKKSYEKEVHSGRILHPFINPIIARAEKPPTVSDVGISYLIFPYMRNRDLRHNIDLENGKKQLSHKETNSRIWTRCIYQIVQAVDYLHTSVKSVRGPVFHQDLTSHNIFLDDNFNARIGDFGIAAEANFSANHVTLTKVLGTEGYQPPDMSQYKCNASDDIFSIGVVMLEFLTGEMAVLKEDPYFLYKKYNHDQGTEDLIDYLDERANENEAAAWSIMDHRNKLAEIALNVVSLNGTSMAAVDLVRNLDEMHLDSRERYCEPDITDICVSCCINPTAKLALKGADCVANENKKACQPFCLQCLMNHHVNPLVCPKHGKTRPPFGDHVYGVFVAGNNVESLHTRDQSYSIRHVAQMFINDAKNIVKVLTAKYPFVMGTSTEHLKIVKPTNPGTKEEMETHIKDAFRDLNSVIKKSLKDAEKDRLPDSLFIFYFSGHCSKDEGLYLGNEKETLKASTKWIKEMLHETLRVDQVLVILDCFHADSQNFGNEQESNTSMKCPVRLFQLSPCSTYDKSTSTFRDDCLGSYFTHLLCQGLQGLEIKGEENDEPVWCVDCKKQRHNRNDMLLPCEDFYSQSRNDQCITLSSIKKFIQGHFDLLGDENRDSNNSRRIQEQMDIVLAYYNPCKSYVSIHLKGSENMYHLSNHQESMDSLKQDIVSYIVEKQVVCDILILHESYVPGSSYLVAICQKHNPDKSEELTSLESIYNSWSLGHELEARVRENIKGLIHGPVKLTSITKSMDTDCLEYYDEDYLKISRDSIRIPIKSIRKAEEMLWEKKEHNKLIQEVLQIIRNIRTSGQRSTLEKKQNNVLTFYLYDAFSVLTIQ